MASPPQPAESGPASPSQSTAMSAPLPPSQQDNNAPSSPKSPSPPPEKPTAATPGPRATRFMELYQQTLNKTLSRISYEDFAACFPTIAGGAAGTSLREMHGMFVGRLRDFAEGEINSIYRERNVVENLNALEDLLADARRRKARAIEGQEPPTPAHLLPPNAILAAHLTPQLTQQQSSLNAKLQTTQSQNAQLFQTILEQRQELESLVSGLEGYVHDLEGAVEAFRNEKMGELASEIREVDMEMAEL